VVETGRIRKVYNVRVADDHTYFVGGRGWGFSLWVHNAYSYWPDDDGTWVIIDEFGEELPNIRFGSPEEAKLHIDGLNVAGASAHAPNNLPPLLGSRGQTWRRKSLRRN
jgi:hypothetical protein